MLQHRLMQETYINEYCDNDDVDDGAVGGVELLCLSPISPTVMQAVDFCVCH